MDNVKGWTKVTSKAFQFLFHRLWHYGNKLYPADGNGHEIELFTRGGDLKPQTYLDLDEQAQSRITQGRLLVRRQLRKRNTMLGSVHYFARTSGGEHGETNQIFTAVGIILMNANRNVLLMVNQRTIA